MKELLHNIGGGILHQGGKDHAQEKGQQRIITASVQSQEDHQGPVAVDGTERAVEKAPLLT